VNRANLTADGNNFNDFAENQLTRAPENISFQKMWGQNITLNFWGSFDLLTSCSRAPPYVCSFSQTQRLNTTLSLRLDEGRLPSSLSSGSRRWKKVERTGHGSEQASNDAN